jgi:hypothetical protein
MPDRKIMERTEKQIQEAQDSLADFFYPPIKSWDGSFHKPNFQGWRIYVLKTTEPEGNCNEKDCTKLATMRIRLNIWGCLYEFDVCEKHGTHDGKSRDGNWCDDL